VAAAEEYEASAATSPSIQESSPAPASKKKTNKGFTAPKARPSNASAGPSRPAPRPLANASHSNRSASASDNFLLTAAERQRILTEETKRENEQCFDFLKPENVKDKDGNRPDHPDYDKRTILVPKNAWASFTPFEKQFWEIKQNHFDTVLFFQKGKFYELYEDDALIGHQEFDLKLTDRVKMKMVSFTQNMATRSYKLGRCSRTEFRFVGFQVSGKRIQSRQGRTGRDCYRVSFLKQIRGPELMNRMEIRQKDAGNKGREIVRRELGRVFTNGTIVDGEYLSTHDANHCVSIKELSLGPNEPSTFGICILDASTGEFNLSYFQDDIIRTRLETLFRQIRPKELICAKVSPHLSVAF
jgi:DNA mismatch repair protein MSH6